MEWICKFCLKTFNFEKFQQRGAHLTNCSQNPKHTSIIAKQVASKTLPRIEVIKNCLKCLKEFIQLKTEREIETDKDIAIYCSHKCANSHSFSAERKAKISTTLKTKYLNGELLPINPRSREVRRCIICSNAFECILSSSQQTCSRKCSSKLSSKKLKGSGKVGGYKVKSGTSKFRGSYYNGIWMDSSWEVALAVRLDAENILWQRDDKYFLYNDIDGEERKYYPDFYLPDYNLYVECKGYWTPKVIHKMKDVQERNDFNLMILEDIDEIKAFSVKLIAEFA